MSLTTATLRDPKNISFINIPGNEDMAIKGNTLYADAYGDLVTFDITNPHRTLLQKFCSECFPRSQHILFQWIC